MAHSADRNLLFGILALQMDFITRDALIAAMNAWVLEKARSLGDLLAEHGALAPADRDLLEPLVRRHIEQHGGDPSRSLRIAELGRLDSPRALSRSARPTPTSSRRWTDLSPHEAEHCRRFRCGSDATHARPGPAARGSGS